MIWSSVLRPFFNNSTVILKRFDCGSCTKEAFFSSFILTAPSFERIPKAEPTSLFSRLRASAISGSFSSPFSFKSCKILCSGVPRSAKSVPIFVSSKNMCFLRSVSFIKPFILSHEKTWFAWPSLYASLSSSFLLSRYSPILKFFKTLISRGWRFFIMLLISIFTPKFI